MPHPNTPPPNPSPTKPQPQRQPPHQRRDTSPPYPNTPLLKLHTPAPPPQTTTQPPQPPALLPLPNILNTPPKDMRRGRRKEKKKGMTQNTAPTTASKIVKACTSGTDSTILSYESASCGASTTTTTRKRIVTGDMRSIRGNRSRRYIGVEVLGTNMMIRR